MSRSSRNNSSTRYEKSVRTEDSSVCVWTHIIYNIYPPIHRM
jgi:hypothetical protein